MAHVEPMDLDSIESDFDDKENTYQHNNALPRVSTTEKGYEELDVSELNMKLRYSVTPAASPMSKSYAGNCIENRNITSVEDVLVTNNHNLTRSLNSTMTNSDSILKSPKSLPLQSLPSDQVTDFNRNSSLRRSLDAVKNNVTVTVTQDIDDNLSLPSTSSSLTHTPEATTPTKEIPKQDGGSPIMRGLKSVLSMFRTSQSPIPPNDEHHIERKEESLQNKETSKQQTVLASTPIRNKNGSKSGSPLKDSVVFKDDLEQELQWKDDSTIIFKEEKIPIHKLFLQSVPVEINPGHNLTKENINNTVEYMDISMNESTVNDQVKHAGVNIETNCAAESDSEFQDCETTFNKTEQNIVDINTNVVSQNITGINQEVVNMSIVENEYDVGKLEQQSNNEVNKPDTEVNTEIDIQPSQEHSLVTQVETDIQTKSEKVNDTISTEVISIPASSILPDVIDNALEENIVNIVEVATTECIEKMCDIECLRGENDTNPLLTKENKDDCLDFQYDKDDENSGQFNIEVNSMNIIGNTLPDLCKTEANATYVENSIQGNESNSEKPLELNSLDSKSNESNIYIPETNQIDNKHGIVMENKNADVASTQILNEQEFVNNVTYENIVSENKKDSTFDVDLNNTNNEHSLNVGDAVALAELPQNISSERISDLSKIICSDGKVEENKMDVTNIIENVNELNQSSTSQSAMDMSVQPSNMNVTELKSQENSEIDAQTFNVTKIIENDSECQTNSSFNIPKPSDIPLPFEDDITGYTTNETIIITDNIEYDGTVAMNIINTTVDLSSEQTKEHVPEENPKIIESNIRRNSEIVENNEIFVVDEGTQNPTEIVSDFSSSINPEVSQDQQCIEMNDLKSLEPSGDNIKDNTTMDEIVEETQSNDNIVSDDNETVKRTVENNICNSNSLSQKFDNSTVINEEVEKLPPVSLEMVSKEGMTTESESIAVETNLEVDHNHDSSELMEQSPFDTKCKVLTTPPSSPKIVSKGYNFNFDEIDDPFATKTKIRESPTPVSPSNNLSKPVNENRRSNNMSKKTDNKIQNRRKSQPVARKQCVSKKAFNSTFDSTTTSKNEVSVEIHPSQNNYDDEKNKIDTKDVLDEENLQIQNNCDISELNVHVNKNELTTTITEDKIDDKDSDVAVSNSNTNLPMEINRKNVFNIPEIDDKNFNPFASRSKICVSPTHEKSYTVQNDNIEVNINDKTVNISNSEEIKIDDNMEKVNSSVASNNTFSSKHTDEKDVTVREMNTEDEDTIEGPILEAEDLADFDKDTDILPACDKDDMIGFDDFPPQSNDDNGDNPEIFIDAEAFEFLLNQNKSNVVADSGKESLFLKFDPLFAQRVSSDGILAGLNRPTKRVSTPKKIPQVVNHNLLTEPFNAGPSSSVPQASDYPEDNNMNVSKPTMIVNPAVNSVISPRKASTPPKINRQSLTFTSPAMAVIDRLLSLSGNANTSLLSHDTSMPQVSVEQRQTDLALTQLREMLAEKEIHVQTLRSESKELKDRLAVMESQVKTLETESKDRLMKISELNEKLLEKTKVNKTMATVVEEYERTIASLVAELEQDKRRNAEERMKLIRDRDEQTAHLASMEVSFSDLHSKYEKSKQIILSLKANEDAYKKSAKDFDENLLKMQNNYELLKQHATSKLNHANSELEKLNRAHEAEVLKLNAMIKRKDLHITSLEETLAQKTKANEELTAICDELINKVG